MNLESQYESGSDSTVYDIQGMSGNENDSSFPDDAMDAMENILMFGNGYGDSFISDDGGGNSFMFDDEKILDLTGQTKNSSVQNENMQPIKTIESCEPNSPSSFNSEIDVRSTSDESDGINSPILLNVPNIVGEKISSNEIRPNGQPMLDCRIQDLSVSQNQSNGQFYQFNAINGANGQGSISSFIYGVYAALPFVSYDYQNDFQKFIEYLNYTIAADEKKNIKKVQLVLLHNLFMQHYGWNKLTREELRKNELILWKFYQQKQLVKFSLNNYPIVFVRPVAQLNEKKH